MPVPVDDIRSIRRRERIEEGPVVFFNNREIRIPFRFIRYVDEMQSELEHMRAEIRELRSEVRHGEQRVDNETAGKMIASFIRDQRKCGIRELDVLDIADALHLPFSQVSQIMHALKSRGIREAD